MTLLLDNERREQAFTIGESRSRLRFGVKQFYPQMCAKSNRGPCLPHGMTMSKCVWFRHGHF